MRFLLGVEDGSFFSAAKCIAIYRQQSSRAAAEGRDQPWEVFCFEQFCDVVFDNVRQAPERPYRSMFAG
jgi:hypothetical protein